MSRPGNIKRQAKSNAGKQIEKKFIAIAFSITILVMIIFYFVFRNVF